MNKYKQTILLTIIDHHSHELQNYAAITKRRQQTEGHQKVFTNFALRLRSVPIQIQKHYMSKPYFNLLILTLSQMTNFRLFQTERVCRRQFQV